MRANPISRGGSYYPPRQLGLAYHAISAGPQYHRDRIKHAWLLHDIWADGKLLSSSALRARGVESRGAIEHIDRAAGDDRYVFLSATQPITFAFGDEGFLFVFSAERLLQRHGTKVGMFDLMVAYQSLHLVPSETLSLRKLVKVVQRGARLSGRKARAWLDWLYLGGDYTFDSASPPPAALLPVIAGMRSALRSAGVRYAAPAAIDLGRARNESEILVRDALPISSAVGVIFDKVYFDMGDFRRLFAATPGKPIPHFEPVLLALEHPRRGHPYRCPACAAPLLAGETAAEVMQHASRIGVFGDRVECGACGLDMRMNTSGDFVDTPGVVPFPT